MTGMGDAQRFFIPRLMVLDDFIRTHSFFIWNPYQNAGEPVWIDPQCGVTSPLLLAVSWLMHGSIYTFLVVWIGSWFAGGLGMLVLGRRLGAPVWAAAGLSLLYLFNGFYISNASFGSWIFNIAAAPWFIWLLDDAMERRSYARFAQAGALWGLAGNGGHPAVAGLLALLGGAWLVSRWLLPPGKDSQSLASLRQRPLGLMLRGLLLCGIVGIAVISPPYIGMMLEGRGYTGRSDQLTTQYVLDYDSWQPNSAITAFSPLLGYLRTAWPMTNAVTRSTYMGAAVLVLAAFALGQRRRFSHRWFLLLVAVFGAAMAAGKYTPIARILVDAFPLLKFNRHLGVFKFIPVFMVTLLAMEGAADVAHLAASQRRGSRKLLILAAVLGTLAIVSVFLMLRKYSDNSEFYPPGGYRSAWIHLGLAWSLMMFFVIGAGRLPMRTVGIVFVAACLADAGMAAWISRGLYLQVPNAFYGSVAAGHPTDVDLTHRGLNRETVAHQPLYSKSCWGIVSKRPILQGYTPMANEQFKRASTAPELIAIATGVDRVWFASNPIRVLPGDKAFDAYCSRVHELGAPPLLIHSPSDMGQNISAQGDLLSIAAAKPCTRLGAEVLEYTPRRLHLKVNAPSDGFLVVTDRWSKGWRVVVNGSLGTNWGAMFHYRAVEVKGGINDIVFDYNPIAFYVLLVISWGTLAAVGIVSCVGIWRRHARRLYARASRATMVGEANSVAFEPFTAAQEK